jgi:hypothetical protein
LFSGIQTLQRIVQHFSSGVEEHGDSWPFFVHLDYFMRLLLAVARTAVCCTAFEWLADAVTFVAFHSKICQLFWNNSASVVGSNK